MKKNQVGRQAVWTCGRQVPMWLMAASCAAALAAPASAQDAGGDTTLDEIVVTGFRGSLASAIETKKNSSNFVDAVNAEDIAKFPDLNLAESLQRIPGIAIDRDGGEGRTITVRGLSSDFTRVRLNGLEALATTGGTDGSGGANRGRGFDFNIFASELFNNIKVNKSQSAEIEEGSLGATVDLQTGQPFDYKDFTFAASAKGTYNDLSKKYNPRATLLVADKFLDDKIGVLASAAYSTRNVFEEGASTTRWEVPVPSPTTAPNPNTKFRSVPANLAAQQAWHPRIPRYGRLDYDQDRLGLTGAIQLQPFDNTRIDLNVLYAKLKQNRTEQYLEAISFSRTGAAGMGGTDVVSGVIDDKNALVQGRFNGVDMRTEYRRDELNADFLQYSVGLDQGIGESVTLKLLAGWSSNTQDNPEQTTVSLERYNSNGYSYDFTGDKKLPGFDYGFDVTNPANWAWSSSSAQGDASLIRMRPNKTKNEFVNYRADLLWDATDNVTLKTGFAWKKYDFKTEEWRRINENAVALPAGTSVAQISKLFSGFGRHMDMPAGTPSSWIVPDLDKIGEILGIYCNCTNQFGNFTLSKDNQLGQNRDVTEKDLAFYGQADFNFEVMGKAVRGNIGLRRVKTEQNAFGYVGTRPTTTDRSYWDTLPSMNVSVEATEDVFVRFAAGKVMARPRLPDLTPGGSINSQSKTLTIGNPDLEPYRANTVDIGLEWYPDRETLVSVGYFYKDIKTYIQNVASTQVLRTVELPLESLPAAELDNLYTVTRAQNTEGGPLKGFEISVQKPFTFLPAPFDNLGGILNYTHVKSNIVYNLPSGATNVQRTEPLVNLSPNSLNATLYYETEKFSVRVSGSFRDAYLTNVAPGNNIDVRGKNSTFNLDLNASYNINEHLTVSFEAINLTDQYDDKWVGRDLQAMDTYVHSGRQFFLGASYKY
ncbi:MULTISPECIES: TonB-dependent receptor [unclassified Azospirillum]|uniref:TonB-dependent receptor n=1 Tax=unclassified Azospirillum TaxID=2630922 RepID=UPI000B6EE6DC|nr:MULTISPECIES: TonB-dependent receptor [unclassified Azospirillum]SNS19894.1 TonB-dependent receptor [Azospirillum sp. RU38E]SNS37484.1 TonB-dependent receptor [Azospirillum sp. RU37A]